MAGIDSKYKNMRDARTETLAGQAERLPVEFGHFTWLNFTENFTANYSEAHSFRRCRIAGRVC
jgi:hypothetical protein